jgi:hypothetical protein
MANTTDTDWTYSINGVNYGPVKTEAIRALIQSNYLKPDHLARRVGDQQWKRVSQIDLNFCPQPNPPRAGSPDSSSATTDQTTADTSLGIGAGIVIVIVVIGAIAMFIAFPPSLPVLILAPLSKLLWDKFTKQ